MIINKRLYSVILNEDELRLFDEISSENDDEYIKSCKDEILRNKRKEDVSRAIRNTALNTAVGAFSGAILGSGFDNKLAQRGCTVAGGLLGMSIPAWDYKNRQETLSEGIKKYKNASSEEEREKIKKQYQFSVTSDEDELRMFDEISSEAQQEPSNKKDKLKKGATIGAAGAAGATAGVLGAGYVGKRIGRHLLAKDILKNKGTVLNGVKYNTRKLGLLFKEQPNEVKHLLNKEVINRYGKNITVGKVAGGTALGLAAGYGAYKYLKNKDKKKKDQQ